MINIIIWLAAFICPNPHHTLENHGNCHMMHFSYAAYDGEPSGDVGGDTGGETAGHPPITLPPPPPPPQP